jgi:asparagine synthase (glutamine-hydrolysing)
MVALMSRHSSLPVNTFSVGFHEAQFDETAYARDVARRFGANHNEWRMRPEDVIRLLPETIHYRDAPMTEPTDVAMFVLARQAAQSVKMVLTGEGADEFLAGYPKYKFEPWVRPYQRLIPAWLHDHGVRPLAHGLPAAFYRVTTVADCFGLRDDRERLPRWFGSLNYAERDALASPALPRRAVSSYPFAPGGDVDALRRCLYFDQTSWLPDNLLERGDRMTMAASIEARMPFMDQELAAFAASLPRTDRIRGNTQKWLLRQAMQPILPADILTRRKIGFRVPVSLWFRSTLREYVRDHLLGPNAHIKALCRPEMLEQKLAEHEKGRANHEKLIWGLLNLELFQKEYGLGL